jgi:hypothetical protein
MSGEKNLEQRYRRVLRLLPGYYRDKWEDDMVAAFLDSWLTGDPYTDKCVMEFCRPTWPEVASVAGLAVRLYLTGAGAPRRHVAREQAIRWAVLAVALIQAVRGLDVLVLTAWSRHLFGWLPVPPSGMVIATPGGALPPAVWYLVAYAWIVSYLMLVLRYYRTAQLLAALAIVPDLVVLLQGQFTGRLPAPYLGPWAFWVLLNLAPVLAMTAFHRDAAPAARLPWLLALPINYLVVVVPLLALGLTGNSAWVPDFSGLYCILVALACLARTPWIHSRRAASSGVWSLTLALLAADAGAYRIFSIADYVHDTHLINVSLAELLILVVAVALVVPDAARARAVTSATPPYPQPG